MHEFFFNNLGVRTNPPQVMIGLMDEIIIFDIDSWKNYIYINSYLCEMDAYLLIHP